MEEIQEVIKNIKSDGIIRKLDELGRIVIPMEYRMSKIIDGETMVKVYNINNQVIVQILDDQLDKKVKKFDNLGRVVIQKEIRKKLGWIANSEIKVWNYENSFILQKVETECVFCRNSNNLIEFKNTLICQECKNELRKI